MDDEVLRCQGEEEIELYEEGYQSPEKALLTALLARSLEDASGATLTGCESYTENGKQDVRRKARRWIMSDERESSEHFTFLYVCEVLGYQPGKIRSLLDRGRPIVACGYSRVGSGFKGCD